MEKFSSWNDAENLIIVISSVHFLNPELSALSDTKKSDKKNLVS